MSFVLPVASGGNSRSRAGGASIRQRQASVPRAASISEQGGASNASHRSRSGHNSRSTSVPPPAAAAAAVAAGHHHHEGSPILSKDDQNAARSPNKFEFDCHELREIAARQRERIHALRISIRRDVERNGARRRQELEGEKHALEKEISELAPKLERARGKWLEGRQGSEHETQWGDLHTQLTDLREQNDDAMLELAETNTQMQQMQEVLRTNRKKLRSTNQELHALRSRVKQALECGVVDENMHRKRIQEEENYLDQLRTIESNIQAEYSNLAKQDEMDRGPLAENSALLSEYLEEMQGRTRALRQRTAEYDVEINAAQRRAVQDSCKATQLSDYYQRLEMMDSELLHMLQTQLSNAQQSGKEPLSVEHNQFGWLKNYYVVWEAILQESKRVSEQARALSEPRHREVTAHCELAEGELGATFGTSNEEDTTHRTLVARGISDLVHFIVKKKRSEEQLSTQVERLASDSGENVASLMSFLRREGYADILPEEASKSGGAKLDALPEEGFADIERMRSSLDAPESDADATLLASRARDNINGFIEQKAHFLNNEHARSQNARRKNEATTAEPAAAQAPPNSIQGAIGTEQHKVMNEIVNFVRGRQQKIHAGAFDPRSEEVLPDNEYFDDASRLGSRIQSYVEKYTTTTSTESVALTQRGNSRSTSRAATSVAPAASRGRSASNAPNGASIAPKEIQAEPAKRITVQGARLPVEVQNGNEVMRAKYFLSCAIRGFNAIVQVADSSNPQPKQLFVSRDFRRVHLRDVSASVASKTAQQSADDITIKISDIVNVIAGQAAVVNKKLRGDLSFALEIRSGGSTKLLGVQCDNSESRTFWAAVLAWVCNETTPEPESIVTRLQQAMKIVVIDAARSTPDTVEPSERGHLFVQIAS